eukprot:g398.t1
MSRGMVATGAGAAAGGGGKQGGGGGGGIGGTVGSVSTALTPLRVPLADLCAAEERGRWWVAGAPWQQQQQQQAHRRAAAAATKSAKTGLSNEREAQLRRAAEKQRFTTDVQKAVFVVLMSSSDFQDAFERLLKLNLKDKQERAIVHVLVHCCAQERAHNPYYSHLARKFCDLDHNYKFTFQLTLWDRLKLMRGDEDAASPMPLRKVANLAQLLGHLLVSFSLSLSILKVLEWDRLTSTEVTFLRVALLRVLMDGDPDRAVAVFQRLHAAGGGGLGGGGGGKGGGRGGGGGGGGADHELVRNGVALFFHRHMRPKDAQLLLGAGASDERRSLYRERLKLARHAVEASATSMAAMA